MSHERLIRRYRRWYAKLIRLYPKTHRDRFGEGMEQTFNDLLNERVNAKGISFGWLIWTFSEAFIAMMGENMSHFRMRQIPLRFRLWSIVVAVALMFPLVAMQISAEADWGFFDFVFMGILLLGAGLGYEFLSRQALSIIHKIAAGMAVFAVLHLVWVNAAVGIIGDHTLANSLYFFVAVVGVIGAWVSRFQPSGMARTMFSMALLQVLVPLISVAIWRNELSSDREFFGSPGWFGVAVITGFFFTLFVTSALMFQHGNIRTMTESLQIDR